MNEIFVEYCEVKGIVHPQKIFLQYVILRTVTKYSTIIMTKNKPDIIDIGK